MTRNRHARHCYLGLGNLYRRTGKREQAQEHLTTAATMYREMDMGFWLEKRRRRARSWEVRSTTSAEVARRA